MVRWTKFCLFAKINICTNVSTAPQKKGPSIRIVTQATKNTCTAVQINLVSHRPTCKHPVPLSVSSWRYKTVFISGVNVQQSAFGPAVVSLFFWIPSFRWSEHGAVFTRKHEPHRTHVLGIYKHSDPDRQPHMVTTTTHYLLTERRPARQTTREYRACPCFMKKYWCKMMSIVLGKEAYIQEYAIKRLDFWASFQTCNSVVTRKQLGTQLSNMCPALIDDF